MQRLVAIMVGFAFVAAAVQVSALHTHSYTEHDHPEHDHGPAAHEHSQSAPHHDADDDDDDDAVHIESCDPGQHAVSITVACPSLPRVDAFDGQSENGASVERLVLLRAVHTVTDVRVHGPPPRTLAPPRAPPDSLPA